MEHDTLTAEEFRQWRKQLGFTQARAADELGRKLRSIRNYESGAAPVPRPVALACAALGLGADVQRLRSVLFDAGKTPADRSA